MNKSSKLNLKSAERFMISKLVCGGELSDWDSYWMNIFTSICRSKHKKSFPINCVRHIRHIIFFRISIRCTRAWNKSFLFLVIMKTTYLNVRYSNKNIILLFYIQNTDSCLPNNPCKEDTRCLPTDSNSHACLTFGMF